MSLTINPARQHPDGNPEQYFAGAA